MKQTVQPGDIVVLIDEKEKRFFVNTNDNTLKIKGIGVFDPHTIVDTIYGTSITIGSKEYWVFWPSLEDKLLGLKRKAQIILPEDAALIIMHCAIESGHTVVEAGVGSGSLTTALAHAVAPNGKILSHDIRDDFIKHAEKNLKQAQISHLVTLKNHDITQGIAEKNVDAIILDIPNPYDAIKQAYDALKPGGYLCTYSPLISQVEQAVEKIHELPFIHIHTMENIKRNMVVKKQGTRPSFNMLGHTGYLTFARKILVK